MIRKESIKMEKQKTKLNIKLVILCWILGILVVVGGVLAVIYTRDQGSELLNAQGLVIADNAEEWNKELPGDDSADAGIKIPGYSTLTINGASSTWNMSLVNPEGNSCYFKYTLTVEETGETIYESDLIEPGKAISSFDVSNAPTEGDYTLLINIATFTMDGNLTSMNGAQVKAGLELV
jgi:hypothetical protein